MPPVKPQQCVGILMSSLATDNHNFAQEKETSEKQKNQKIHTHTHTQPRTRTHARTTTSLPPPPHAEQTEVCGGQGFPPMSSRAS